MFNKIGVTNFATFIDTKNKSDYPNMEYHYTVFQKGDEYLLPELLQAAGIVDEIAQTELSANQETDTFLFYNTLLNPKSKGRILLNSSCPFHKPLIYPNYLSDEKGEDAQVFLESVKIAEKLTETKAFVEAGAEIVDINVPNCR